MMATREALLARTFVEVADTLVDSYDVVDLLTILASRCVELFDIDDAGLMLARDGSLHVAASSSDATQLLELFEIQHDEGPCVDCYETGERVCCDDVDSARDRWPAFVPEAIRAEMHSVFAVPLRLRDQTIGSLNLLRKAIGPLDEQDLLAAQAIADVATIGIIQSRVAEEARLLSEQLQRALDSRVAIEQAKGILAASIGVDVDSAFSVLRRYARDHNERLTDVATALVAKELTAASVATAASPRP